MLTGLELKNFKCFEEMQIELKNVNVFTGVNGVGKSTVIQALLLLRQSYLMGKENHGLYLNGRYAQTGNSQDVLYDKAQDDLVGITLKTSSEKKYMHLFAYEQDVDCLPAIENSSVVSDSEMNDSALYGDNFVYLSAYRINPRERYGVISEKGLKKRNFGNDGEFARSAG
ncbi:MAG: AAA family ATPase [Lachnospiraceae bacterium]|nr:AAA family ATPase [Lachnospiraceae bacterium]